LKRATGVQASPPFLATYRSAVSSRTKRYSPAATIIAFSPIAPGELQRSFPVAGSRL
jgi:hypothetical protein